MTDTCVRCGERPPVPGRLARRCGECLETLFGRDDHPPDAVVLTVEYADGRARRYVADPAADGEGFTFAEFVRTEGGTWRPIGEEPVAGVDVRLPADPDTVLPDE